MNQTITNALRSLSTLKTHDGVAFLPPEGNSIFEDGTEAYNKGLILDVTNNLTDLRIAISIALASKTFKLYEQNYHKSKKGRRILKRLAKYTNKEGYGNVATQ